MTTFGLSRKVRAWHRLTRMSDRMARRMGEGIRLGCEDVVVVDRVVDGCPVLIIIRGLDHGISDVRRW